MAIDDKIRDENYNMIFTEKQQKYQLYHLMLSEIDKYNILQVKKYYFLIKDVYGTG